MDVKACWLTINRACNLRCSWCYAKSSKYSAKNEMNKTLFCKLVDIAKDLSIQKILLIGGEPTIHKNFLSFIRYLKMKNIKCVVVSNGIKFSDEEFCKEVIQIFPDIHIDISLKGSSELEYKKYTLSEAFYNVVKAIKNLNHYNISHSVSYVLTKDNITKIDKFFEELRRVGINERINFAFCNPSLPTDNCLNEKSVSQVELAKLFEEVYDEIHNEQFSISNTAPLCMQNQGFIDKLLSSNKISTTCHVHSRSGLIFDTNGELLLCNSLVGYNFGQFGVDYNDARSLTSFWDSEEVLNLYNKFSSLPSKDCVDCNKKQYCSGGCCMQYFEHSFEDLKKIYKEINLQED